MCVGLAARITTILNSPLRCITPGNLGHKLIYIFFIIFDILLLSTSVPSLRVLSTGKF